MFSSQLLSPPCILLAWNIFSPTIPYLDCTTWGGCLYSGKSVKSASLRSVKMTVFQSGLSQVKYPAAASASSTFIILSAAVSVAPSLKKPDTTRIVLPILVSVTQSGRRAGRLFLWVSVIGKSPFRQAAVSAVPFFPVRRLSSNSPR